MGAIAMSIKSVLFFLFLISPFAFATLLKHHLNICQTAQAARGSRPVIYRPSKSAETAEVTWSTTRCG